MRKLKETPSQTAGPYLHIGMMPEASGTEPKNWTSFCSQTGAKEYQLNMRLFDGGEEAVTDAIIEVYHASGMTRTTYEEANGLFSFGFNETSDAPFTLFVMARGINVGLCTRVYLPDEAENLSDNVLQTVPEARRETLIAKKTDEIQFMFDIHLQGEHETVFLEF